MHPRMRTIQPLGAITLKENCLMNTSKLRLFLQLIASLSSVALVAITNAQPAISNVYPNGTNMFQPSSTLSFTASSAAGVTNVTVGLTITSLYTGSSFLRNLTASSGLTITGPATALSVSATLKSNTLYSAVIQIRDANGAAASQTVTFDTINPSFTWEAEDWDFTSNGVPNLYIDNPQTNAYRNLDTTIEGSNNNGPGQYRPSVPGPSTETTGSPETTSYQRVQYIGTGMTDYDVGWTDGGEFAQYTRHYPAGTYNLFARVAGGNGARTECADITVVSGAATISGSGNYKFGVLGRGWQNYDFMPVTDNSGALIQITFDGNPSTIRVQQNQASDNMNFFMLMPLNTNEAATTVTITNVYPDGAFQFEATNQLAFTATSSVGIGASDVTVQLTGTNLLSGQGSVTNLTAANGLTITGSSTDVTVTAPLTSNTIYTAFIQVNDANGIPASVTVSFDTIIPAYTFEAEDWDYSTGQYVDNPQVNAYASVDGGADQIDVNCPNNVHSYAYRGGALAGFGLNNENASDVARAAHVGFQDYDIGFTSGGNWANYTRHYPAGIYNIFVRAARGDGGNVSDAASFALVTSGYQTTSQTTSQIGKYGVTSTGNWQKYAWFPVRDNGGNLARFTADNSLKTLRVTMDGAGHNQNFFMFVPADLSSSPPPFVSDFKPDGSSLFEFTNTLTFTANSSVGIANTGIVVTINGATLSGLTFSGPSTARIVSAPVPVNESHTAVITLTDVIGTTRYTNVFSTFNASNYQWEAEDYDYNSGQYFDNQINAYNGLGSVPDVDNHQSDLGANPFLYRLDSPAPSTQTGDLGGEKPRAQFTSGGGSGIDYCIGFFGGGSWVNYTRHYPAGTYYVVARCAEGQNLTQPTLGIVTSGVGTSNQTVTPLGSFSVPPIGWSSWEWAMLKDSNGKLVKVTLDGSPVTLRYSGSTVPGQPELNTGFFMLAATTPDLILKASRSGGNIVISFPTLNGVNYQVEYKNNLTDPNWSPLGSPVAGNGAVQSVSDSTSGTRRFYRVHGQ
jgi:hypothetical protein